MRARTVVGNWKNGVAKKYIFCLSRRSEAMASERNEHDKREMYFICGTGKNMTFGPIQCLVRRIYFNSLMNYTINDYIFFII